MVGHQAGFFVLNFLSGWVHYPPQEDLAKFGKEVREESRKS
jgi:hypothetical protein